MRKYLFSAVLIALSAVVVVSCKKDKDLKKATVVDTGDIAFGGCGYVLEVEGESEYLRPSNLPTAYMHDGFKVKVKFDRDGEGDACQVFPKFEFLEVIQLTVIKTDLD